MGMKLLRRRKVSRDTCFCGDAGLLNAAWAFGRDDECNCGTADELHDSWCDTVPCPFCPPYWRDKA